jgi:hypothetical protein
MLDDLLNDSDPAFSGTIYALIVIVLFCATSLAVGVVYGVG